MLLISFTSKLTLTQVFVAGMMAAIALLADPAYAQAVKLPNPSRTVFKCEVGGKVLYSDDPCLGAKRIDVEPTRGLDKSSGKRMIGKDVGREKSREAFVEALRPVTGQDQAQHATAVRRINLSSSAKAECRTLDGGISDAEALEQSTAAGARLAVQRDLLNLRKRYRELGC
jgi:hypothetical protein